jgi:hypothetical protein
MAMKTSGPITVKVYVENGLLWVDREPIYVWGGPGQITWELATPGYEFHPNTVSVHGNGAGELSHDSGVSSKTRHVWNNKNSFPGLYKYTLSVLKTGGGPHPAPLDPGIGNQGS